jgi:hypothetical protein
MKNVIYKEIIEIDGKEYQVSCVDYSESVNEWECADLVSDNSDIINMITDDIVNSSN